jgi:site-specific DNA-methyltransferase (adenine-specific)
MTASHTLIKGDCIQILKYLPAESIDLIITSPPYCNQRQKAYGGVKAEHYVEWFMPIAQELHRVLKPQGSFILNIKERAIKGERHTYVLDLILAMRKHRWLWVEEYIWHKKNSYPGKWPNRFRDAFERCLHFTKQKQFCMYQENVMVPAGGWINHRLKYLSQRDYDRCRSQTGSNFGRNMSNWLGREWVYPTNVLNLATECSNTGHSAAFPIALPEWFIRLFTQPRDLVLDPFLGSGSTAIACLKSGRASMGIEINPAYLQIASNRLRDRGAVSVEAIGEIS